MSPKIPFPFFNQNFQFLLPKFMGNYRSSESRSSLTAKLILVSGQLQEFLWPIKVSLLLPRDSGCFICSSDEMEFGEFAAAMGGDEELRPGEIYFELPLAWRNVRLQAEDMAALALKASVALASRSRDGGGDCDWVISWCCCCRWRQAAPEALFCEKEMPLLGGDGGGRRGRGKSGAGGAKAGRKFVRTLSSIVED